MRFLVVILFSLLVLSCDPAYHLRYAVMNSSGQPIYCVDKQAHGAQAVTRIEVDSAIQVYEESGFGRGRGQFKESRADVAARFVFYTDSTLSDSSRVIPGKGWKFHPLPIGDYNARVYIRRKDLK